MVCRPGDQSRKPRDYISATGTKQSELDVGQTYVLSKSPSPGDLFFSSKATPAETPQTLGTECSDTQVCGAISHSNHHRGCCGKVCYPSFPLFVFGHTCTRTLPLHVCAEIETYVGYIWERVETSFFTKNGPPAVHFPFFVGENTII